MDSNTDKELLQRYLNRVQEVIDELDELMTHMNKIADSKQHKSTILKFKNKVCDINCEHRRYLNIYRDLLLKYDPLELK